MSTYKANYYNINGIMTTLGLGAATLVGAKREAYRRATGEQTRVVVTDQAGQPLAERSSTDSFRGFCAGVRPWADL